MKILFVGPGNSVHLARWIVQCQSQGIEVALYTTSDFSQVSEINNLILTNLPRKSMRRNTTFIDSLLAIGVGSKVGKILEIPKHFMEIRRAVKKHKVDIVHVHWLFHSAAFAASFIPGIKLVSTPWGSDVQWNLKGSLMSKRQEIIRRLMVGKVVRRSIRFSCDALHLQNRLVALGAKPGTIEIIYFGVDVELFSKANYSETYRKSIGVKPGEMMVLSNRGLEPVYDVETFIMAASIAIEANTSLRFFIASSGSQREQLEILVDQLGLSDKVKFLGRLSNEEFPIVTASSDIYVSTSTSDGGLAASVAEAMSSSVAVINTDFGENGLWLRNESAGLIFPIGDHENLAKCILRIAGDHQMRILMGEVGRSIISEFNNSVLESKKILDFYRAVVKI